MDIMETTKLMQNQSETNTLDLKTDTSTNVGPEATQEQCDLAKKENVELCASTHSVKCCNGFMSKKSKKVKMPKTMKETQATTNGTLNGGKCYFASLKERFGNGKHHMEMKKCVDVDRENLKKSMIFEDRDPFKINSNIKYEFAHVFAEPNTGTYSFKPIWSFNNHMYFGMKLFFYRLFSILIGIPLSFLFSIVFALLSVLQIWCANPVLRLFSAFFGIIRDVWSMIVETVFGPLVSVFYTYRQQQRQQQQQSSSATSNCASSSSYNDDANMV